MCSANVCCNRLEDCLHRNHQMSRNYGEEREEEVPPTFPHHKTGTFSSNGGFFDGNRIIKRFDKEQALAMKYFTVHSLSMYLMTTTALSPESGPESNGLIDFAATGGAGSRQFSPAPARMASNDTLYRLHHPSPRPNGARGQMANNNNKNNAHVNNGNSLQRGRKSPSVPFIGKSNLFSNGKQAQTDFGQSGFKKTSNQSLRFPKHQVSENNNNHTCNSNSVQVIVASYPSSPIHTLLAMERAGFLPASLYGTSDAHGRNLPVKQVGNFNATSLKDLFGVSPPQSQNINLPLTGKDVKDRTCLDSCDNKTNKKDSLASKTTNKDENNNSITRKIKSIPNTRFRVDQVEKSRESTNLVAPINVYTDNLAIPVFETNSEILVRPNNTNHKNTKDPNGANLPGDNKESVTDDVTKNNNLQVPLQCPFAVQGVKINPPVADLAIRLVHEKEIVPICHWRAQEFGYGAHWDYLQILHKCYPEGWFIAHDSNGDVIGNIFGMNLSDKISFGGLFSVKKPYRCRGIGGQLWNMRKAFVGDRNLGVNAVASRIVPNQKLGMFISFEIVRYRGIMSDTIKQTLNSYDDRCNCGTENVQIILNQNPLPKIVEKNFKNGHPDSVSKEFLYSTFKSNMINAQPLPDENSNTLLHEGSQPPNNINATNIHSILPDIIHYDTKIHTIPRERFIEELLTAKDTITIVCLQSLLPLGDSRPDVKVLGYGALRPRYQGFTIGPVYADSPEIGTSIFLSLLKLIPNGAIFDFMMTTRPSKPADTTTNPTFRDGVCEKTLKLRVHDSQEVGTEQPISTLHMHKLIEAIGHKELHKECTLYRMYTKWEVELPFDNVYCITSSVAFLC